MKQFAIENIIECGNIYFDIVHTHTRGGWLKIL